MAALRKARLVMAVLFSSLLLTACDFDVYSLPLPGGADTGENPIEVKVEFADVLDLVPHSSVKFNEVSIGRVKDIELGGPDGRTAIATLELRSGTGLPDNAHAAIRQTSLLGEKFVSLTGPTDEAPQGELGDEDVIPLARTGRNPEVEEVLGALSLVLNGGGIAQLKTITQELNLALEGREENVKSALRQINEFMGRLDERKGDIVAALESLNRLAEGVRAHQGSIDQALEELPSAVLSLDRQRGDLVRMLEALNELSDVGVRVINQTKEVTLDSFEQLLPVLTKLADSGEHFVNSFEGITWPFVDAVVGRDPQVARNLHMGDYTNLDVEFHIDLADPHLPTICVEQLNEDLNCSEIIGPIFECIESQDPAECESLLEDIVSGLEGLGGGGGGDDPLSAAIDELLGGGLGRAGLDLGTADPADLGLEDGADSDGPLAELGRNHDPALAAVLGAPLAQGGAR